MTDNEIIKALEQHNNYKTCSPCPYEKHSDTRYCLDVLLSDVFSLVTRQKEEIERLKNRDLQVEVSEKLEREIKAEAVKEFAEKVKERASKGFWETDAYIGVEQIEELVKEMVGEEE